MKLTKGYTLSQFVDYIIGSCGSPSNGGYSAYHLGYVYIEAYNDFLKQPLKKEMFVNEIEKPNKSLLNSGFTDRILYDKQFKRWQSAEKKVIFKNVKWNGFLWIADEWYKFHISECKNLGEMFRKSDGKIELQNITL